MLSSFWSPNFFGVQFTPPLFKTV